MNEKTPKPNNQELLVEYQSAQDSAQHHDLLIWTITGVIWGAGLVLIGFVIQNINNPRLKLPVISTCILAILLLIYLLIMVFQFGSVRNQKYARCKEIEKVFHFEQHSKLRYKNWIGRIFYYLIMVAFITTWVLILATVLSL